VLLFLIPGPPYLVLALSLLLALYLTGVEVRELGLHWKWWFWWLSFVFLTHFVGYLILRGYAVYRRWHAARA
jgi:ABC-type multidrug transport system permease subunit